MKYIIIIFTLLSVFGAVVFLQGKNLLIKTDDYKSLDEQASVYQEWSKGNRYFVKTPDEWYCFDIEHKMVYLPNRPWGIFGMYFFNHDMSSGVAINFEVKVENGYLNWQKDFIEFSHGNKKKQKIIKKSS